MEVILINSIHIFNFIKFFFSVLCRSGPLNPTGVPGVISRRWYISADGAPLSDLDRFSTPKTPVRFSDKEIIKSEKDRARALRVRATYLDYSIFYISLLKLKL